MKKLTKKELTYIIKHWKLSQKVIDLTDKELIKLAEKIIAHINRRK